MHPLLRAIYDDPASTERRLVYADHLVEREDPRGTFIHLQCLPNPTSHQIQRARELLNRYARQWLGPLHRVVARPRFRRGFLAAGKLRLNDQDVRLSLPGLRGDLRWRTLEALHVGRHAPEGFDMVMEEDLPILEEVTGLWDATQVEALTHGKRRPWKRLGISEVSVVFSAARTTLRQALAHTPGLPELRSLELGYQHRPFLVNSLLNKQLERVSFMYGGYGNIGLQGLYVPRLDFVYRSDYEGAEGWLLEVHRRGDTRIDLVIRRLGRNPDPPRALVRDVRSLVTTYEVPTARLLDEVPRTGTPSMVSLKRLLWAMTGSAAAPLPRAPEEIGIPEPWIRALCTHERGLSANWPGRARVHYRFLLDR